MSLRITSQEKFTYQSKIHICFLKLLKKRRNQFLKNEPEWHTAYPIFSRTNILNQCLQFNSFPLENVHPRQLK